MVQSPTTTNKKEVYTINHREKDNINNFSSHNNRVNNFLFIIFKILKKLGKLKYSSKHILNLFQVES